MASVPISRGQGNDRFRTSTPIKAAKRGQTVAYDVNGAPQGGVATDADRLDGQDGSHYLDRANHTGTQPASSINNLSEAVQDIIGTAIAEGANISVTYDDPAGSITIAVTGLGALAYKGTVNNADWFGADLAIENGGTGASTPAAARDNLNVISITDGDLRYYRSTNPAGYISGNQPITLSGDASGSGTTAITVTLATVNSNTGTYGGAQTSPQISVDGKGRVTSVSAVTITPTFANIQAKPTTLAGYGITDAQPLDTELSAIAGLVSAADRLAYFTGSGTAALATFTAFGRSLVDDADAAAARTTLSLGTASLKNTGTSGDAVPVLNGGATTWASGSTWGGAVSVNGQLSANNTAGSHTLTGLGVALSLVASNGNNNKLLYYNGATLVGAAGATADGAMLADKDLTIRVQSNVQGADIIGSLFLANTATPATPGGGGRLFVQGGALKFIGSSGTVTTIATA